MHQRRRGHACAVLPVWWSGHIIKSVRQVPDMMINAASSPLQTNHVIESKNTSFTLTYLVLKFKKVPSKSENGKKWLDICDVDVHSNAPVSQSKAQRPSLVCSSLQVFSRCNSFFPGVNLAFLLHGLFFFFNYVHCKLHLLLAPTARQSDRHRRARGLAGSIGEDRQNSVALETAEHHQPLLNDLLAVSLVTGKRKMWRKLSVGRTWKRAKRLLPWQGSWWRRALTRMSRTSQSEKTETWCSLIADTLAQNKPVVSSRHHNKELKRDPKKTRQTAATSEGKTELECSRQSFSPYKWLCSRRDNHLSNRDLPRDEPRQ